MAVKIGAREMTKDKIDKLKAPKFSKSRKKHWTEIFGDEIELNLGIILQHGRAESCKKIKTRSSIRP